MSTPAILATSIRRALIEKWPQLSSYPAGPLIEVVENEIKSAFFASGQKKPADDPRVIPPPLEAVKAYFAHLNSKTDPEEFFLFYQQKDWMIGRNQRMRNWHVAAQRWDRNGWGVKAGAAKALTEWERKQKSERLIALRKELQELRYPGGCAYAKTLEGAELERAQRLHAAIQALAAELN